MKHEERYPVRPAWRLLLLAAALAPACSGAISSPGNGPAGRNGNDPPGNGTTPTGPGGNTGPNTPATPTTPAAQCKGLDAPFAPMRRLTREQYANALRDLLGVSRVSTATLTPDENVGPFHSNPISSTTELVAQQFMEAAESFVKQGIMPLTTKYPCAAAPDVCANDFVAKFGLRAYRRPLTAEETGRYKALFTSAARAGYAEGVRVVAQTMLQSPHFLYHVEFAETGPAGTGNVVPLGPYALAARLSFFLWNSIPDDGLFMAAGSGQLNAPAGIKAQVERMLKDPKARDTITSFHLQWLDLEKVSSLTKDTKVYPAYNTALRDAMRSETINFVDHVIRRGDGKLETLLTSESSMLEGPLFALYGVTQPAGFAAGQMVALNPQQRAGLLTHASVLAVHAHANQSSPVSRGVVVRKNLLCQDLPDPPPDVNSTPPDPKPGLTTRERFIIHKKDASCAGCHRLIDDLGFGFERYDGIGAYRATESDKPVDAKGEVFSTSDANGPFDGAVELAKRLARSKDVEACVVKQWFRYALGRFEDQGADACALEQALGAFAQSGRDVRVLLTSLATSDAFRFRRTAGN